MVTSCRLEIVLIGAAVDSRRAIVPAVGLCHTLVTSRTRMRLRCVHRRSAAAVFVASAARMLMLWLGIDASAQP